jgi:signal transduction histidine kinase
MNLLNNSRKALVKAKKKTIDISTSFLENSTTSFENCILIKFEDTGPGIPEAVIQKIPYRNITSKISDKGLGIGLHISYDIIRSYRGTFSAKNTDKGAEIIISIPIKKGQ